MLGSVTKTHEKARSGQSNPSLFRCKPANPAQTRGPKALNGFTVRGVEGWAFTLAGGLLMSNSSRQLQNLVLVRSETMSPAEYLRLSKQTPHLIARSRFVPPRIGERSFGSFEVQFSVPMLRQRAA